MRSETLRAYRLTREPPTLGEWLGRWAARLCVAAFAVRGLMAWAGL